MLPQFPFPTAVGPQSAAMAGNLAWPLAAEELATIDWLWLMYPGIDEIY